MSGKRSYIVRLLRRVEAALAESRDQVATGVLGKIIARVSRADDVQAALETLYCVRGYDQFALRLMWSNERLAGETNGGETGALEYEVDTLRDLLAQLVHGKRNGNGSEQQVPAVQADFFEVLHRFGRAIEELKRKSLDGNLFHGIDEDSVYRVLAVTEDLHAAATTTAREDVSQFASAVSKFLHHALDRHDLSDIRVLNIVDNANLTLQTVLEVGGSEDYDSLHQTIDLLGRPAELLEQA